jgi:hypothetical protein
MIRYWSDLPIVKKLFYGGMAFLAVILLLQQIEARVFNTLDCYRDLRYSHFLIDNPHSSLWRECAGRHLAFPFYF